MALKITFIGHASVLISYGDRHYLVDPVYNRGVVFFHRKTPPGIPLDQLPPIHGIFISHGHYDHFDQWTLKKFPGSTPLFVAKGLGVYVRKLGFSSVLELSAWQTASLDDLRITATPAHHSGKQPFFHKPSVFIGFVLEHPEGTVYFSGDSGYFPGFKDIGKRFKIDVAILPIGAYRPKKNLKKHMNPPDALRAFKDLGARWMIPIHWGTFHLGWEPLNEPIIWLQDLIQGKNLPVRILNPGESASFK
ncbi:MAG: MBL fold metallo-hydrolase [Calditrichaeota bacterium]|nr:MBL fold metallo-hydrolase [Calditrichota bacterium]